LTTADSGTKNNTCRKVVVEDGERTVSLDGTSGVGELLNWVLGKC